MSIISVTTYGSDPQTVNAANLNALVTPIITDYNGNIDNTNIATSAGIANSKLNLTSIAQAVTHTGGLTVSTAAQTMTSIAINEAKGADIASATSTAIGAATGNYAHITGTTTITSFDSIQAGTRRILEFDGILVLTHNGTSLILPTGANITTAAGDTATMVSEGSGNWRCTSYQRKDGTALAGGYTPSASNALSGSVIQVVNVKVTAESTGTTALPIDNTIPQITEGTQLMTLAITPNNSSNALIIDVTACYANGGNDNDGVALFQDSTANALNAVCGTTSTNQPKSVRLLHYMAAGTTSATTFKVRVGTNSGNTVTLNGASAGGLFNGVNTSSITIWEIKA